MLLSIIVNLMSASSEKISDLSLPTDVTVVTVYSYIIIITSYPQCMHNHPRGFISLYIIVSQSCLLCDSLKRLVLLREWGYDS